MKKTNDLAASAVVLTSTNSKMAANSLISPHATTMHDSYRHLRNRNVWVCVRKESAESRR